MYYVLKWRQNVPVNTHEWSKDVFVHFEMSEVRIDGILRYFPNLIGIEQLYAVGRPLENKPNPFQNLKVIHNTAVMVINIIIKLIYIYI